MGPEKIRIFEKLDVMQWLSDMPNVGTIQIIWMKFYDIYKIINSSNPVATCSMQELQCKLKTYMSLFTSIYQTKNVTPYIHVLITHIPEFLDMYRAIVAFSQQGLEKLNDEVTQDFRSTDHGDGESLNQLLFKLKHLEEMTYDDCYHKNKYRLAKYTQCLGTILEHVSKNNKHHSIHVLSLMYVFLYMLVPYGTKF